MSLLSTSPIDAKRKSLRYPHPEIWGPMNEMNPRFLEDLREINEGIEAFNRFLNSSCQIPTFDSETMTQDLHCSEIIHGDWNAFRFPNSEKRGVYFLFGHERTTLEKNGLYIGKSSFGSAMGHRLYTHLHPHRAQSHFTMGYGSEVYILDFIASVDLDTPGLVFLAPALEEFLIVNLRSKLNLMNGTGNWSRL